MIVFVNCLAPPFNPSYRLLSVDGVNELGLRVHPWHYFRESRRGTVSWIGRREGG